ncbi:MAG: MBL fold metallo-hydrolase [Aggregatilineales bacterium]
MQNFICKTCGVQYAETENPPEKCIICEDERQYVGHDGQQWTTLSELNKTHKNIVRDVEPGLHGIGTEPRFAIGQRALLIQSDAGNILWDCITNIDVETIAEVKKRGGISAIAISHPHYYSSMIEWSRAFDNAPIYIHSDDKQWITRPDPAIKFWDGETLQLQDGITLINNRGHFDGSTSLHWQSGADGKGALLTGDTLYVTSDRRYVSFMYSFPNYVPLPVSDVKHIIKTLQPFDYDRIYSAWFDTVIPEDGKAAVNRSAERYIAVLEERWKR